MISIPLWFFIILCIPSGLLLLAIIYVLVVVIIETIYGKKVWEEELRNDTKNTSN